MVDRVALITLMSPVLATMLGHLLANEPLHMSLLVGSGTILLGLALYDPVLLSRWARRLQLVLKFRCDSFPVTCSVSGSRGGGRQTASRKLYKVCAAGGNALRHSATVGGKWRDPRFLRGFFGSGRKTTPDENCNSLSP